MNIKDKTLTKVFRSDLHKCPVEIRIRAKNKQV